jgi:hypothetical protein
MAKRKPKEKKTDPCEWLLTLNVGYRTSCGHVVSEEGFKSHNDDNCCFCSKRVLL